MNILCLDLGTSTGWALGNKDWNSSGAWDLKPDRFAGGGMRFVRLRRFLDEMHGTTPIAMVWYEEVRRHAGTDAAHVYGGLWGTLTAWCEERQIPYEGVPVGEIKKFWTGRGNATKAEMRAVAEARGPVPKDVTEDEIDALALFALKVLS